MSADKIKPDEAASTADLPAKTDHDDVDTTKVKGGGIVPEVNSNSLLSQPPTIDPVGLRGIGARGIGARGIGFRG
jgi:hypothetical protein